MVAAPPSPMTRFFVKLAMPMTSWGTTWPTEMTRSQPLERASSMSMGSAVVMAPPERSAISSAGTSPSHTSWCRQRGAAPGRMEHDPKHGDTWARSWADGFPAQGGPTRRSRPAVKLEEHSG